MNDVIEFISDQNHSHDFCSTQLELVTRIGKDDNTWLFRLIFIQA